MSIEVLVKELQSALPEYSIQAEPTPKWTNRLKNGQFSEWHFDVKKPIGFDLRFIRLTPNHEKLSIICYISIEMVDTQDSNAFDLLVKWVIEEYEQAISPQAIPHSDS